MSKFEIKDGVAIIPEGTTEIREHDFRCPKSLKSIIIPESVTKLEEGAFKDCTSLKSIIIPKSVTKIGLCAFSRCTSLESIVVAEGNLEYDSREGCNAIIETKTNTLILGCKSTIIPESVTRIRHGSFAECSSLKSITIPESVTEIGASAFLCCISLKSVTILTSATKIGDSAFDDCRLLETIYVPANKADYYKQRLPWELRYKIVELESGSDLPVKPSEK